MARRQRVTRLVGRFKITRGESGQEQRPFVQNNGGTFSFSTGSEGIQFSLSDTDLLDLIRRFWRVILEDEAPAEPPARRGKPRGKG
jgi:hypothetical protein